ncbi:MAG: FGGY family carbohydrate kinase [Actinobacteria bacterium]|nr:FGGY family carbohydrate kinase [Cyanobacteriota bacterium]MCL5772640.1 FGGY family carbohydrate kinase [Actinomycetota bacterium]
MNDNLIGIDLGSGGCKVTLLNVKTKIAKTYSKEYTTYYPAPRWAEQNSYDWINSAAILVKKALAENDCNPESVLAVGLSGVTHSPVLLDKNMEVIERVIHITDSRSFKQAEKIKSKYGEEILRKCLNPVGPMWTISMLSWVKETDINKWNNIRKIIFPKDYLRFILTGSVVTDYVDAEGTLLFNPVTKKWEEDFIKILELNPDYFPDILKPADIAGKINQRGKELTGLKEGTPVITGTTDTLLEILAAGNLKPGNCTAKLATFGRICVLTDKPFSGEGIINYSYIIPGLWYPGTGTKSFASSFRWIRDELCKDISKQKDAFLIMDKEAEMIPAGSEGLIFHPYLVGEGSPYNDSHLRGDFLGINLHHTRAHFIRAVLEGTSFSMLDCLDFIKNRGIQIEGEIKFIGGGSNSNLWTSILADVFGRDAEIPANTDASFGAAMLAGVGVGFYKSVEEAVKENSIIKSKINFNIKNNEKYKKVFKIYKDSKEALTEINHNISLML